jgi:hypothetical protein
MGRNSAEEDLPGIDQPGTPEVPGFDIGFAPQWQGDLEGPVHQAQDFLADLRGKILTAAVTDIMGAAGAVAGANIRVAEDLQGPLDAARRDLEDYRARITADLVQPVMDAVDVGRPWGVFPEFEPGLPLPTDILETRARLRIPGLPVSSAPGGGRWVLDQAGLDDAIHDYQFSALPLRFSDPEAYSQILQAIEARFPDGSIFRADFNRAVLRLDLSSSPPASIVRKLPAPVPGTPSPGPGGSVAAPGSPVPGGGFLVTGDPGGLFGTPIPCPPGGVPDDRPSELRNDPNRPRVGSPGVTLSSPDSAAFFAGWPARSVGSAGETVWTCPPGSQLQYRPNDPRVQCIEPGAAACYRLSPAGGPGGGLVPGVPGGPGEVPVGPGPEVPCVKICGLEELIEELRKTPEKESCRKWKAWKDATTGECYVQPADKEPRSGLDKFLLESSDCGALIAAVNRECKPREKRPEKPGPEPGLARLPLGAQCDWLLPGAGIQIPNGENPFAWLLGLTPKQVEETIAQSGIVLGSLAGPVIRFLLGALQKQASQFWTALEAFLAGTPCASGENAALTVQRIILNVIGLFTGDALDQVKTPIVQNSNFLCPTKLPTASEASAAWLRGYISDETWACWVRACGMRPEAWEQITRAQRNVLTPDQIVRLVLRGQIPLADLPGRLRQTGLILDQDVQEALELARYLPGPSDIVRFMVRDVADPNIVNRFGLDDEFQAKFQGQVLKFAEAQGIDPQTMRDYWRAHWSIPSPTQLYVMYHRLRGLPPGDPNQVTEDDIRTALQQQDILPFWVDKLLAISFRPLRLVDIRRGFNAGTLEVDQVRQAYREIGYSDKDVEILVRDLQVQKVQALKKLPQTTQYAAGEINEGELRAELAELGYQPAEQDFGIQVARFKIERGRRKACAKAIKRRFLTGGLDKVDAGQALIGQGLDSYQASALVEGWACERASRGKEFSAGQLCKLFAQGLVEPVEFVQRLVNVGWDRDQAIKLFSSCSQDVERKRQLEELRRVRQAEAQAEKQAAAREKAQAKLDRAVRQQASTAEKLQRINRARNSAIISAGGAYAQRTGSDLGESVIAAREIYRNVTGLVTADRDTIIRALVVSSRTKNVASIQDWQTETLQAVETELKEQTPT